MIKQPGRFASITVAVVTFALLATRASASQTADLRCNEIMMALSSGNYPAATAHFDPTMKDGFSPERLGSIWQGLTAANGKLISWEITQRATRNGQDIVVAPLKFDHNSDFAAVISVNSRTGEVSGVYFAPTPASARPATSPPYAVAKNLYSVDVHVGNAPFELPGILTIPTTGTGPWPGVVLLGFGGPADKDESVGPNHIYKDVAEGLSSRGVVVLRYDKRTLVYGKKMDPQHTTIKEEYLDDAIAAVDLLRSRKEVAKNHTFIAGHSAGATIAPEVALKVAPIQGLILLAPSGRKMGAIWVQQMRFLGEASPQELHELERKAKELDSHLMPPTENFMDAPASYWYDLDARNEVALARQLDVPILILHGGRDYQSIDKDIEHWQEGLKGVPQVRVETFPALNHMFLAGTGKPNNQEYFNPGHVDQQVIDAMSAFIKNPLAN